MFEDKLRGLIVSETEETVICRNATSGDDVRSKIELLGQIYEQYQHLETSIHGLNASKNNLRQNAPEIAEELQAYLGTDDEIFAAKTTLTENIDRHLKDLTPEVVQEAVRSGAVSEVQADQITRLRIRWQREQELRFLREASAERGNERGRE